MILFLFGNTWKHIMDSHKEMNLFFFNLALYNYATTIQLCKDRTKTNNSVSYEEQRLKHNFPDSWDID